MSLVRAAAVVAVLLAAACSSPAAPPAAHGSHPPSPAPTTPTTPTPPPAPPLATVPLRAADVVSAGHRVVTAPAQPVGDTRVRTLLTWCTRTASTEDDAATAYGPTMSVAGPHGANTVYSYARDLPTGTTADRAAYAARLVACWRSVLLPVLAAPLDVHIDHLTVATGTRAVPLGALPYGSAEAAEGVVRWHPTPAVTESSVYDVAVVFGAHTEATVLTAGADGLTTGPQHLATDVLATARRIEARELPGHAQAPAGGGQGSAAPQTSPSSTASG